jgi:hypothetical protein
VPHVAADIGDYLTGGEVVGGGDAGGLQACLGGHRHVEQSAELGIGLQEGEEPARVHLAGGRVSGPERVVEVAQELGDGRACVRRHEVAHGVRMAGAQQLRRGRVGEAAFGAREEAVGGQQAEHAAQRLGTGAGVGGKLRGRPRRVAERVGDLEIGHRDQAVPDQEAPERLHQRVEGRLPCTRLCRASVAVHGLLRFVRPWAAGS